AKMDVDGFARIEVYDTARFFTVTGRHLDGTPTTTTDGQRQLDELCARLWPKAPGQAAPIAEHVEHGPVDMASRERRCRAYLEKCPDAISGQGGHNATLRAACECFRFGLDEATAWSVMRWFNDVKTGGEPWTEKELAHK